MVDYANLALLRQLAAERVATVKREALTTKAWKWHPYTILTPEIPCPFCREVVVAHGAWWIDPNTRTYYGGCLFTRGESFRIHYSRETRHPHTQGNTICMGDAEDIGQWFPAIKVGNAFIGAVDIAYWITAISGHECDQLMDVYDESDPEPEEEDNEP